LAPLRLSAYGRCATSPPCESIGSSTRIEGSRLTDREVERLLANLEIKKFSTRDEQEVAGYAEVMETIFQAWAEIPITENHIKQLHRDLLRYSDKDERHRGEYKTLRNDVGAFDTDGKMIGVVFETATPFDTPRRMQELVTWLKDARELKRLHPLLITAVFIVTLPQHTQRAFQTIGGTSLPCPPRHRQSDLVCPTLIKTRKIKTDALGPSVSKA
jgi:hypothetical protein